MALPLTMERGDTKSHGEAFRPQRKGMPQLPPGAWTHLRFSLS